MGLMIAYICTFSSVRAKCPSSSLAQKAIYSVLLYKGIQRWVFFTNLIMGQLVKVYELRLKVGSSKLSWLVPHLRIFRLFMKGKLDAYVLWPLAQKSSKLNSRPVYCL